MDCCWERGAQGERGLVCFTCTAPVYTERLLHLDVEVSGGLKSPGLCAPCGGPVGVCVLVVCSAGLCAGVAFSERACYFPPHTSSSPSSSVNPSSDSSRICHFCQSLGHHYCSF